VEEFRWFLYDWMPALWSGLPFIWMSFGRKALCLEVLFFMIFYGIFRILIPFIALTKSSGNLKLYVKNLLPEALSYWPLLKITTLLLLRHGCQVFLLSKVGHLKEVVVVQHKQNIYISKMGRARDREGRVGKRRHSRDTMHIHHRIHIPIATSSCELR
jgi:hypothetical protein